MLATRRTLVALSLLAPLALAGAFPAEAGRRSSGSSDGGKTTASRSSSGGSGSSARSSGSQSRGSRAAARATKGGRGSAASAGAAGTRVATRGTAGAGVQVASGRATYGYAYARGGYYPYYHYRPYYWYPNWWFGPYDWAYYGYPGAYYATFGWRHAYLAYAWPGWYSHWDPYDGWPHDDDEPWDESVRAAVELDVRPKKATVVLDDRDIGQARDYNGRWDELYLRPGMHKLEFRHPGYKTYVTYLEARPGRSYRIDEALEPGDGLDPRSMEEPAPELPERPALDAPGTRADGDGDPDGTGAEGEPDRAPRTIAGRTFTPPTWEAEPDSGATATLRRGLLRLTVEPADAAVYLDGEFLARGGELNRLHGAVPVAAGVHRLEVVRPGYVSRSVEIEVEEGSEPTAVDVRLKRE